MTRDEIQKIEWAGPLKLGREPIRDGGIVRTPIQTCPACSRERGSGHAEWCFIAAALRAPAVTGEAEIAAYRAGTLAGEPFYAPPAPVAPPAGPCQHKLKRQREHCLHGLAWGTTCEQCILSCPDCWDEYSSSASYGPRPAPPAVAGGDAPEIQVGDDVTANSFPDVYNVSDSDLATYWNTLQRGRVDSIKRVIWRRRQEGQ